MYEKEKERQYIARLAIADKQLLKLYNWYPHREFIVFPASKFTEKCSEHEKINALKQYFQEYNLCSIKDSDIVNTELQDTEIIELYDQFSTDAKEGIEVPPRTYWRINNFDEVLAVLNASKILFKSLLFSQDIASYLEQSLKEGKNTFIQKNAHFNRLCTYAQLDRTIKHLALKHVQLPLKGIILKNIQTNEFIFDAQKSAEILDTTLKIGITKESAINVVFASDTYSYKIFAQKVSKYDQFHQSTYQELKKLVTEIPFDIGFNNIFPNDTGGAVIIDTENKYEHSQSCIGKLKRYKSLVRQG